MASTGNYAATVNNGSALLTAGDTSRTAPATVGTIMTGGALGSRCDNVDFVAVATTVLSAVRLFKYDGANYRLLTERTVPAFTAAVGSVWELHIGTQTDPQIFPIELKATESLRVTVNDAQTGIVAHGRGGDF